VEERFAILREIGAIVLPEYRFKWPQLDWWSNEAFTGYLRRFSELHDNNTDRRWMLWQLLRLVDSLTGDTAECGVYAGASSYLICRRNRLLSGTPRRHYVCDSFEGLSAPSEHDGCHWTAGDLACDEATVRRNLAEFEDSTVFVKGWIPASLSSVPADREFSFVHVDVDLYQPTLDSVRFFYPRMQHGAVLLCDDYGFETCPGATRALDEYFRDKPEKVVAMCSGGGFIIKGRQTAVDGRVF
jgi:O-methyltransferase